VAKKGTTKKASPKKSAKPQAAKKQPRGLGAFYRQTVGELKKVSWPTRREAINLTWVVIIVMGLMAILLGGLDYLFYKFFDFIVKVQL
jgi:preprotein translocase subunit SecE